LITGGAGSLGKAFAAECASRGWNLMLTDLDAGQLAAVAEGLERMYGVQVQHYACDLTDADEREVFWQFINRTGLRFHMLVNVAGLDFEGAFNQRKVAELRAIVRLNIENTVEMTRRILAYRDPARTLRIINVASLAAFYPMPVKAVYAASKRFLLDLSMALNQELRSSGVTITALCPAGLPTRPDCIERIEAQGFMGLITTRNVGDVVARTIDLAIKGRAVYIPGFVNQLLWFAGLLVPPGLLAILINRRWQKAHEVKHVARTTAQPLEREVMVRA
jgi:short-subunit dehydrogenase